MRVSSAVAVMLERSSITSRVKESSAGMRIAVQGGGLAAGDVEWRLRGSGVEEVRFTLSAQKKGVRWFRNQLTSGWCRSGMRMIFEISEDHPENYDQSGETSPMQ
ncbi:hypothetical protein CKAH01_01327 [Colletotrichum kahawae]|uniref:Uncharacterized protein n=1 Tax=Colletotrichum kahawae TaxID=34407 RepID=A0AAD9YCP4_COLKA|nr:hypothetical protein CKAH01_01327 [Colletotrichum kahawae]